MYLFHGSPTRGMTVINPHPSSVGEVVCATYGWLIAFYFAGRKVCNGLGGRGLKVAEDGIVEYRAFSEDAYIAMLTSRETVSIYTVSASDFDGTTEWKLEHISEFPVDVISEEIIDDWGDRLSELISDGLIRLVRDY